MTTNASGRRQTSACNGVTKAFGISFQFIVDSEFKLYLHDTALFDPDDADLLTEGVDYELSGVGRTGTATVTTTIAHPTGKWITRFRETDRSQSAEYVPNDGFASASHEVQLDRLSLVDEELGDDHRRLAARALLVPPGESAAEVDPAGVRANGFFGWDAAGNPTTLHPDFGAVDSEIVRVSDAAAQAAVAAFAGQMFHVEDHAGGEFDTLNEAAEVARLNAIAAGLGAAWAAEVAADAVGGVYRPSIAAPAIVHVRRGVDRDGIIRPYMWDVKGDGRDAADITEAMQAMFDFSAVSGHAVHLDPRGHYETLLPLFVRGAKIYGNGATLINVSDSAATIDRVTLIIGLSHPALDDDVPQYALADTLKGDEILTFSTSAEADNFPVGKIFPMVSAEHITSSPTFRYHHFKQCFRVLKKNGATITLDRPIAKDLAAPLALDFDTLIDATTGKEIHIADRPLIRDLHVESRYYSAMLRMAMYEADLDFLSLKGQLAAGSNMLCHSRFRCRAALGRERVLEIASGSHDFEVDISDGAFTTVEADPVAVAHDEAAHRGHVKVGEGSRNGLIRLGALDDNASTSTTGSVDLNFCSNIRIEFANLSVERVRRSIAVVTNLAVDTDANPGDTQYPTEDITFAFGKVHYGGAAGGVTTTKPLIDVTNGGGLCRRVRIESGDFVGPYVPVAPAATFQGEGHMVDAGVRMKGRLLVDRFRSYTIGHPAAGTGITQANPGVFSSTDTTVHLPPGTEVTIWSVNGMTEVNGQTYLVDSFAAIMDGADRIGFAVTLESGGTPLDTSGFAAYTSGGEMAIAGPGGGSFEGFFSDGLDAASIIDGHHVAIKSEASIALRRQQVSNAAIATATATNEVLRIDVPPAGLIPGDAVRIGVQYRTTGTAGTKHVDLYDGVGVLGAITIPNTPAQSGLIEFHLAAVSNSQLHVAAFINGQAVADASLKAGRDLDGTKASATVTFNTAGTNNHTLSINGVTMTLKAAASGYRDIQIPAAGTADAMAEAVHAYVDAHAGALGVTASRVANVVTLTATRAGTAGNAIALAETGNTMTVSAATLSGGAEGVDYLAVRGYLSAAGAAGGDTLVAQLVRCEPLKLGHG
ncbi:MAG TPA: hypothetical protein VGW34_14925 [Allosphingosinicella sp.]|nr:hypothetical protein [Allosphingosinicella sp.]